MKNAARLFAQLAINYMIADLAYQVWRALRRRMRRSTHSPEKFAQIARGLDEIVDVRSHPTSRWEWWRLEKMREWLP